MPLADHLFGYGNKEGKIVIPRNNKIGKAGEYLVSLDSGGKLRRSQYTPPALITFPADSQLRNEVFNESDLHDGMFLLEPIDEKRRQLMEKRIELLRTMESKKQNAKLKE